MATVAVTSVGEGRALSFTAYTTDSERTRWCHSSESERVPADTNLYSWGQTSVELGFDLPIQTTVTEQDCFMVASLNLAYSFDLPPVAVQSADEMFELPCTFGPAEGGAIHVTVVGLKDGFDAEAWRGYLEEQGVWDRHGAIIGDWFYDMFRPVLLLLEGEQPVLYHAPDGDQYFEVDEPPPESFP